MFVFISLERRIVCEMEEGKIQEDISRVVYNSSMFFCWQFFITVFLMQWFEEIRKNNVPVNRNHSHHLLHVDMVVGCCRCG